MKKETFLKIVYICLSIMLIALTIGWVISGFGFVKNEVFAEEIQENAILNFNQQFQYIGRTQSVGINFVVESNSIHAYGTATSTGNYYLNGATNFFNIIANHKYYININSSDNSNVVGLVYSSANQYGYSRGNYTTILTLNENRQMASYLYLSNGNTYNTYITCSVVDLSQMFGLGNEPTTIEEVKNYLPLNYYNYTLGTPISINQFNFENGYNLGYTNGLDIGYKYTNSEIVFKNQINNFENLNTHNKVNAIINEDNTIIYYSNNIGTGYLIPKNKQVIITWEYISAGVFMTLDNGEGTHLELDIDSSNNTNSRYVYSFSSSEDGSLNFYIENEQTITINNLIVYIANDEQISYDNGYNDGWKDGKKSVDTQSYYDNGFIDGKNWQINHNPNSAWGSSWEFIGSAFSGVGDILSIELLPNIPLWTFIAIPLLFGLIALLYKLIGG